MASGADSANAIIVSSDDEKLVIATPSENVSEKTAENPSSTTKDVASKDSSSIVPTKVSANDDDEEEEDIPADFFDDFSNQDFMEGLDIVDAWDEEAAPLKTTDKGKSRTEPEIQQKESKNEKKDQKSKTETVKKRSTDNGKSKSNSESTKRGPQDDEKDKRKDKHPRVEFPKGAEAHVKQDYKSNERVKDLREKVPKRSQDEDSEKKEQSRRDPEKTRRDILKDKDKCEKDQKVKIIEEKLKVVETGLVPPGMEMEVDLDAIKRQQSTLEENDARSQPTEQKKSQKRKTRSKSPDNRKRSRDKRRTRSRSRNRYARRSRDRAPYRPRLTSRSPLRRRRSPLRRSRSPISPKRSPLRRTRSPLRQTRSPLRQTRSPLRQTRSPLRSPIRQTRSPLRQTRSPLRQSRSPLRQTRSPVRQMLSPRQSQSPLRPEEGFVFVRERHIPQKSKSPDSDISDRERWLRRRMRRSRSPRRRSRSRSPDRRRRSKSGDRRRRSKSGDRRRRSTSADRRRRDKELAEKQQSFLEEIHKKLNESAPRNSPQMQMQPQHFSQQHLQVGNALGFNPNNPHGLMQQPQPLIPQNLYVNLPHGIPQYDQQFFIGGSDIPSPQALTASSLYIQQQVVQTCAAPVQNTPAPLAPLQNFPTPVQSIAPPVQAPQVIPAPQMVPPPQMVPAPAAAVGAPLQFSGNNTATTATQSSVRNNLTVINNNNSKQGEQKDTQALAKLFEDKKISLSDFLTVTAKPSDARPVNLKNKINVISRCQDVIKELGGDSKLSGRFFLKETKKPAPATDAKFQSPLRRIPLVRLNFTTMLKNPEEKSTFSAMLSRLLLSVGIAPKDEKKPEPEKKPEATPAEAPKPPVVSAVKSAPVDQPAAKPKVSPVPPTKQQAAAAAAAAKPQPAVVNAPKKPVSMKIVKKPDTTLLGAKFQMKMVQTEPVNCQLCEIRAMRKYANQVTQCERKTTADASTQVAEDEFKTPLKSILKTKSLALLTPAQILAQEKGEDARRKEETKPSPVKAPEKAAPERPPRSQRPDLDGGRFGRNRGFGGRFEDREFANRDRGFERARDGFQGNALFERPRQEFGHNREVEIIEIDDYMEEDEDRRYQSQRFFDPPPPPNYNNHPNSYNFRGNNRRFM